ncbi:MAG: hypothetical protein ACK56F_14580, partial [bacterium]
IRFCAFSPPLFSIMRNVSVVRQSDSSSCYLGQLSFRFMHGVTRAKPSLPWTALPPLSLKGRLPLGSFFFPLTSIFKSRSLSVIFASALRY